MLSLLFPSLGEWRVWGEEVKKMWRGENSDFRSDALFKWSKTKDVQEYHGYGYPNMTKRGPIFLFNVYMGEGEGVNSPGVHLYSVCYPHSHPLSTCWKLYFTRDFTSQINSSQPRNTRYKLTIYAFDVLHVKDVKVRRNYIWYCIEYWREGKWINSS